MEYFKCKKRGVRCKSGLKFAKLYFFIVKVSFDDRSKLGESQP